MRRFITGLIVAYALAFAIVVTMPRESRPAANPQVIVEVLDPTLQPYARMWQDEIARRFDSAVGILVHGGESVEGQWTLGRSLMPGRVAPVKQIVEHYREKYPDRTIVLLACNPSHIRLGMDGVYYARSKVWCVPDRGLTSAMYQSGLAMQQLDSGYEGLTAIVAAPPTPPRSTVDPDCVGNIFEFVAD